MQQRLTDAGLGGGQSRLRALVTNGPVLGADRGHHRDTREGENDHERDEHDWNSEAALPPKGLDSN